LAEYQKSALTDIIQEKKYSEAIVNSIKEPILGLDKERRVLFVNDGHLLF